jgi:ATP-dependent Lhr-like helicase
MIENIKTWFEQRDWHPFPFQEEVWSAYLNGENGLIHSATGTGKTLAAWMGPIAEWLTENPGPQRTAGKRSEAAGLRVLWITPLRALAADTSEATVQDADRFV